MTSTKFPPGFYKCRDGSKAEIFAQRNAHLYGVRNATPESWSAFNGRHNTSYETALDLIDFWTEEPEKISEWIGVYPKSLDTFTDYDGLIIKIRITYTPGKRLNEDELEQVVWSAWHTLNPANMLKGNLVKLVKSYMDAYRIGRVTDTTPEEA